MCIRTIEASISLLSRFIAVLLLLQMHTLDVHDKVKFLGHVMSAEDLACRLSAEDSSITSEIHVEYWKQILKILV